MTSVRKIITFEYLKKLFSKNALVWPEICISFTLSQVELVEHFGTLAGDFRNLGGDDTINPWLDLRSAVLKMSSVEYERARYGAKVHLAENPEIILKRLQQMRGKI